MDRFRDKLQHALAEIIRTAFGDRLPAEQDVNTLTGIEQPREAAHGDVTTTAALRLAKLVGEKPRDVAATLAAGLTDEACDLAPYLEACEIAGPGFLNLTIGRRYLEELLRRIHQEHQAYGRRGMEPPRRVQIEFVSANPTGPLGVPHGRQAAVGDALARILEAAGWAVTREYYVNDTGAQVRKLGESVFARYAEVRGEAAPFPEDGYHGDYIRTIGQAASESEGPKYLEMDRAEAVEQLGRLAADQILAELRRDLEDFGVHFDVWKSQGEFETSGAVERLVDELTASDLAYPADGAVWIRTSAFGDEKDRVLVKRDGSWTYRTPDIAYHVDKFARGFDRVIDLLGPDHHGHIANMRIALQALGHGEQDLVMRIVQLCTLYRGKEKVKMSTRTGDYVTLRELMDEVGVDAMRFFLLDRRMDSHLNFDLELAKKHSMDNPVYYVQYACARIASVMRKASEDGRLDPAELAGGLYCRPETDLTVLEDRDWQMVRRLMTYPLAVQQAAEQLEPQRVVRYAQDLAAEFHPYYTECPFLGPNETLTRARLFLVSAVAVVLRNALGLLGISVPEKM